MIMWAANAIAKRDIKLQGGLVKKGESITITHGVREKYALWHHTGVYDISDKYVDNVKQFAK